MDKEEEKEVMDYILTLVDVDILSGSVTNKFDRHKNKKGEIAGYIASNGYYSMTISYNRKAYYIGHHRIVFYKANGSVPDIIDHKDRNKANNNYKNLRSVSSLENSQNRTMAKNNRTGFTGVFYDKRMKKYKSQITFNGKQIHLGVFDCKYEAYKSRVVAEGKYFGDLTPVPVEKNQQIELL